MLKLVHETKEKKAAQRELERNLKSALQKRGNHTIGFPGGKANLPLYSIEAGQLWVAFGGATEEAAVRRYWNAFGIYEPQRPAQSISVEINIPIDMNSNKVSGFLAKDDSSGDIFLMHSGKVGGGRRGIGKSAFLVWSKARLTEVSLEDNAVRAGIVVGNIGYPDLAERIWAYVRSVQSFKDQAATGALETPEFKQKMKEFERYSKEFSGKKRGVGGGEFEYVTYHGEIVQKLYDERTSQLLPGEQVYNSPLVDLFVKKDGSLTDIYEVKTGTGRQMLYTAIGQLVTHAASDGMEVTKHLVIPADEDIPVDLKKAISTLKISIRRFRIQKIGRGSVVHLD